LHNILHQTRHVQDRRVLFKWLVTKTWKESELVKDC